MFCRQSSIFLTTSPTPKACHCQHGEGNINDVERPLLCVLCEQFNKEFYVDVSEEGIFEEIFPSVSPQNRTRNISSIKRGLIVKYMQEKRNK